MTDSMTSWYKPDSDDAVVFIYDNAPVHRNANQPANAELKPLPAYSPFLNIVEQAISSWKAAIKDRLSRPDQPELMMNSEEAGRQGLPLGEFRKTLLLRACNRNFHVITQPKCMQWYNHMQTYLPRCLNREEVNG